MAEAKMINTTCAYCGVGCGIKAEILNNKVTIEGDENHPANYGKLCSKGLALGETLSQTGRLLHPVIDNKQVEWNQAINAAAEGLSKTIKEHGVNSVAFYVSGQLLTEDYYVANKLIKGFIGNNNIDTNSRLCMSSAVVGHKRAFGEDIVPICYDDLDHAEVITLVGSNLAWAHPILFQRIKAAKAKNPNVKLIVVDPRRTDSCDIADLHLAIKPGTDVALFNRLLIEIERKGKINQDYTAQHTNGLDAALASAKAEYTNDDDLIELLGVTEKELSAFLYLYTETDKPLTAFTMGVNQSTHGSDKVNSIINCHLATGTIGYEGAGPFSVTGQPNAMGGREVGGLANMLASHMEYTNEDHRALVGEFWNTDKITDTAGLKAVDLFEKIEQGEIKAVWVMATNPVVSLPNADQVKRALEKCPLVIVSDCYSDTDTMRFADIKLPAQGWSEKSGTVTNSERRISRQRNLLPAAGEALPDWKIISKVAQQMGYAAEFSYLHEAEIFAEHARLSAYKNTGDRAFNIGTLGKISQDEYDALAPFQWPMNDENPQGTARFFAEGGFSTPDKKANFIAVTYQDAARKCSIEYPFILNTGRIRDQWHTMTRTAMSSRLNNHTPEAYINVHPEDAKTLGLQDRTLALVSSDLGSATLRVIVSETVREGDTFAPMHWTDVLSSQGRINTVVSSEFDAFSGQPEFKHTPVKIEPWFYQSEAILVTREELDSVDAEYWVKQKIEHGYLYRIASQLDSNTFAENLINAHCQVAHHQKLSFSNPNSGLVRFAALNNAAVAACVMVAPRLFGGQHKQDLEWLSELLGEPLETEEMGSILSGEAQGRYAVGRKVCACKNVGYKTICNAIKDKKLCTPEAVSQETEAGTGCGSCLPEISTILEEIQIEMID
ncbi:molybdopterin-dependent oxidoreductase [Algibacillus agarilyticus]|uniref:molybdopterin-dependent oxidoreductase n=1 Tax=Algibacillus agarilyticus TaxID=2234133 RepID=UPI000DD01751|nr:nitrate reductase [Algibacillus agarilyticus]